MSLDARVGSALQQEIGDGGSVAGTSQDQRRRSFLKGKIEEDIQSAFDISDKNGWSLPKSYCMSSSQYKQWTRRLYCVYHHKFMRFFAFEISTPYS